MGHAKDVVNSYGQTVTVAALNDKIVDGWVRVAFDPFLLLLKKDPEGD